MENTEHDQILSTDTVQFQRIDFLDSDREADEDLAPMTFFKFEKGEWESYDFPKDKKTIRLGSSSGKSDIKIDQIYVDSVQVVTQMVKKKWFAIESGVFNSMSINGVKTRQSSLSASSSKVMEIGNSLLVFTTPKKPERERSSKNNSDFTVTSPTGESQFSFDDVVLIGANPCCDIYVSNKEFAAVIFAYNKNLFLYSLTHKADNPKDGHKNNMHSLGKGGKAKIGGYQMNVQVNDNHDDIPVQEKLPDMSQMEPCLAVIDDDDCLGEKHVLPPAGKAFFIGRDPDNELVFKHDSISREHAYIKTSSNSFTLKDCHSVNGTYVNGEKIKKKSVLLGDIICFGTVQFLYCYAAVEK